MKNILLISNNCSAGFIYQYAKKQYNNPFIWTSIYNDDFFKLIENWNSINFQNFKSYLSKHNDTMIWSANIDNKIKIYNTHYIQDDNYETPTIIKGNIRAKDILKYGDMKYITRATRMINENLEPIFIYDEKQLYKVTFNTIRKYLNLKTKFKLMVLTYMKNVTSKLKNNIIYIKPKTNARVRHYSKNVYLKYFK